LELAARRYSISYLRTRRGFGGFSRVCSRRLVVRAKEETATHRLQVRASVPGFEPPSMIIPGKDSGLNPPSMIIPGNDSGLHPPSMIILGNDSGLNPPSMIILGNDSGLHPPSMIILGNDSGLLLLSMIIPHFDPDYYFYQ